MRWNVLQVGRAAAANQKLWFLPAVFLLTLCVGTLEALSQGIIEKILTIKTCGKPNIQNIMNNVTVRPGQSASFKCQVDMSCIVAYIEWYHEMKNGTIKLIKTASSSGDPHVHIIKMAKPEDKGLYTCIAGNFLGQAEASAYLEVNAAPSSINSKLSHGLALTLAAIALILPTFTQRLSASRSLASFGSLSELFILAASDG